MNNDRFGIGLDTCLLQAVDSYLNKIYNSAKSTKQDRFALEIDPRAREQFVLGVDIFVDTPKTYLVIPKEKLGHLAPVGKQIANNAETLSEATKQHPIETEIGIKYYKNFFDLILRDFHFTQLGMHWGWFQILDSDVLLGYTSRMSSPTEISLVKPSMKNDFLTAFNQLSKDKQGELVSRAAQASHSLNHNHKNIQLFFNKLIEKKDRSKNKIESEEIESEEINRILEISASLNNEIKGYSKYANKSLLTDESGIDLFLLAYVGSVCRRGWQYNELYTRKKEAIELIYEAHHMRSDFISLSLKKEYKEQKPSKRVYWWSWGSILAKAIEQRPSQWSRKRVIEVLNKISGLRVSNSFDYKEKEELNNFLNSYEMKNFAKIFEETMIEHKLYSAKDNFHENFMKIAPFVMRILPSIGISAAFSLVAGVVQGVIAGSVTATTTEFLTNLRNSFFDSKEARFSYRSSEFLEEKWLESIQPGQRAELSGGADLSETPIGPMSVREEVQINQLKD